MNFQTTNCDSTRTDACRVENLSVAKLVKWNVNSKSTTKNVVPNLPAGDVVYETDPTTGERTGSAPLANGKA